MKPPYTIQQMTENAQIGDWSSL